ncbi:MAG: S41 family peptidase [Chitinophagaceae bacterium]|nr:S41 family peptidase [Chitinophagaceae bacterium]MBK8787833.1 S41 family peptidase [Chitinophagaceae bacterium]
MKRITTCLLLFFNMVGYAQPNPQALLTQVVAKAKQVSLYTSIVNWDSLQMQVNAQAANAKTINDLKPAFEALLNGLKDHHGSIVNARNYTTMARFTDYANLHHPDTRVRQTILHNAVNNTALHFEYAILKGNVGYLKIVGIAPNVDVAKESQQIRDALIQLSQSGIQHYIVDLRYNGGGNMNPMMAGLGPLIGDGIAGKLVNLAGDVLFNWEINNGNFIYGGSQVVTLNNKPLFKTLPRVAVLTSMHTVSSGEVVATAFKGRPATRFFGEATGGYTTNNGWDIINGEVILNISTGIFCDRNGTVYKYNIPVDTEIPFEIMEDKEKDNCIIAARKWLAALPAVQAGSR